MLTVLSCLLLLCATCIESREHDIYRFSGQVLDSQNQMLFLLRTNGCIRIRANPPNDKAFRQGSLLQITAVLNATGNMTLVNAETLGWKPLPEPLEVSGNDAAGDKLLNRFVRVRGVVASSVPDDLDSRYNWTILRTPTGPVTFATHRKDYPPARLKELIDAEATIDGLVLRFSGWRERLSGRIHPIGEKPFVVTKPAPTDIDLIPPLGESQVQHRQRVSGIVLSPCFDHFFIRTQDGSCIRVFPTERLPGLATGQRVTVAGFVDRDAMHATQLSEALVRIDVQTPIAAEPAKPITMDDLFLRESGGVLVNHLFHEKIVRLGGTLVEGCSAPNCLLMTDGGRSVTVDLSAFAEADRQGMLPGTRISVTGLCIGEFRPHCSQICFPHFGGFTVIPRSIDDITTLARPPWWTPRRFLAVIGILLAGIIAILIWNRALRIASERRGKALAWEQTCHAKSELKVEERTRLAVELHDSISQTLTGVALQIETALGLQDVSFGPAEKLLLTARQMLASCRQELRCCLWDLRSRTFEEQDLTEAIRRTVEPHTAGAHVTVRFNVSRELLSEATIHTILKTVRELVVNAIRHGKASSIRIAGEYRDGNIRFFVKDNGIGFDPDSSPGARQGHFGLQGIRERAIERKGNVKIATEPGRGAKITVMLKDTIV